MKFAFSTIITCSALALFSCENPADETADAQVSEAVEKSASTGTEAGVKYVFTPESKISFVGSKVTGSHTGGFETFSGYFFVEDGAPVGNDHMILIDMKSTFSDDEKLTGHLKSPDFFDVEKYPESKFEVTGIEVGADSESMVSGNFTLHGVTKNITFPATVKMGEDTIEMDAKFDINRKDFGILYPGKTDDLIRDEVVIELDLQAKAETEAP